MVPITLKKSRKRGPSRSSDRLLTLIFQPHFIRVKSLGKCMFPMMTGVCSTSEYRTLINRYAPSDPRGYLPKQILCKCVYKTNN